MRVDIITKEYPPEIYGGAGVHVTELVKSLRESMDVRVRAFGGPRDEDGTTSYGVPDGARRRPTRPCRRSAPISRS